VPGEFGTRRSLADGRQRSAKPLWKDVLPGSLVGKRRRRSALLAQSIGRFERTGLVVSAGAPKI